MRNTKKTLQRLAQSIHHYEQELEKYTPEQFAKKPGGEWSVGQMYTHLLNAAFHMQLSSIEACRTGVRSGKGGKTIIDRVVALLGSFPPVKIKVPPSADYTPADTETQQAVKARLRELLKRVREVEPELAGIPAERKAGHPAFGELNAVEWLTLIEMHFRHHLRQKARLDRFLSR